MSDYISKSVLCGLFIVSVFWLAYLHLSRDLGKADLPQSQEAQIENRHIVASAPPKLAPLDVKLPEADYLMPITYYTTARVTEFHNNGVRSIQKGVRVSVIKNDDGTVTISDGNATITTKSENITSDVGEIKKLTTK